MNKKHLYLSLIILISLIFSFNSLKAISFPRGTPSSSPSSSSLTYNLSLVFKEVDKDTIEIGTDDSEGYATLEWELSGFDRLRKVTLSNDSYYCKASGDWSGEKQISGEEKVNYSKERKTFFLSCYEKNDPNNPVASASAKIEVLKATLTADPSIIIQGESVTLKYSFNVPSSAPSFPIPSIPTTKPRLPAAIFDLGNPSNPSVPTAKPSSKEAYSCTLNEKVVTLSLTNSGESTETPSDDTTYTFKCSWQDELGNHSSSATTTVKVAKLNFDIYPTEYYKETTTLPVEVLLGWESRYFDKCEASSNPNVWQGQKSLTGQETAKVNGPTSFTLTCSGINGDYSRKKSITKKIEEKSLFSFPVWLIANPSQVYQGEEVIVSWGISGSFDSCSLSLKPLCEILGYSNDTSAVNKCNRGSRYYPKIDPECFKNIQHIWDTTKFTLSQRDRAQMQKNPDYSKSFNIGSSGYGSIKIKPDKDTTVSINCENYSEEVGGGEMDCSIEYPTATIPPTTPPQSSWIKIKEVLTGAHRVYASQALPCKDSGGNILFYVQYNNGQWVFPPNWQPTWRSGFAPGQSAVLPAGLPQSLSTSIAPTLVGGGSQSASITIKVLSPTDLQVSLSANPTQIKKGEQTTLTYSAINANPSSNCIATSTDNVWKKDIQVGSDGKVSGSDKLTLNEVKTYEFSFTCYDKDNKSKTATAKVEVTSEECLYPDKIPHNICEGGKCISSSTCGKEECSKDSDCPQPPSPTCHVTIEAKPKVIFLGNSLNLEWEPTYCNECEATTTPSIGGGNWAGNPLNLETTYPQSPLNTDHTTKVTPTQKGEYTYQITCDDNKVWDTAEVKVKVIPVPFWHEIIPVLPGFLRGLFR